MAKLSSLHLRLPTITVLFSHLKLNFYRLHLVYFLFTILLTSVIVYGSSTDGNSDNEEERFDLRYIDALYMCASAMTNTGLNVVNLASITGFQQAVLFILIPMGNLMVVSTSVVYVRKHFFRKKMNDFISHSKTGQIIAEDIERQATRPTTNITQDNDISHLNRVSNKAHNNGVIRQRMQYKEHYLIAHGGYPFPWQMRTVQDAVYSPFKGRRRRPPHETHDYLSFQPNFDCKGRFHSLDEKQRAEIGGVEYQALTLLGCLLPAYLLFWFFLGVVILVPYSFHPSVAEVVRTSQPGELDPGWWATFAIMSSFANCGMNLLDSNMVPFQAYYLILILVGAMILVGNQLFPVFLRFTIWAIFKLVPKGSAIHHTCAFLLHHPRRCFVLLFPSINNWYLFAAQVSIDLVLWASFGLLNVGLAAFGEYSAGNKTIMGLFQGLGVRVGGLYVVSISDVAPALQIIYLVAMYISAFPIIVSLRQTNVYEERSLGVDSHEYEDHPGKRGETNYLSTHIRKQLAYDLWWLALAIFLISIVERGEIVNTDADWEYYSTWNIIFEVVSAYGTVGLSLGVPFDNYSFSGIWHTLSKLILIAVMIRGRHRGLPYAIDRAVMLPGEELMERMDEEVNGRQWQDGDRNGWRSEMGQHAEAGEQANGRDASQG